MSSSACQKNEVYNIIDDVITFNMFKTRAGELEALKPFAKGMLSSTGLPLMTTKCLDYFSFSYSRKLMVAIVLITTVDFNGRFQWTFPSWVSSLCQGDGWLRGYIDYPQSASLVPPIPHGTASDC